MARPYLTLSILALLAPLASASPGDDASTRERDTYRPAATYSVMRGTTPAACEAACKDDGRCRAWSLTPPTFRAGPKCELKSAPGRAVARAAAVSGVVTPPVSTASVAASSDQNPAPPRTPEHSGSRDAEQAAAPSARPTAERAAASPTRSVTVEPYVPAQPAAAASADRPWPGMRASSEELPRVVMPAGDKPLPLRRGEAVPSYSVQSLEALPGDVEDTGGLKGRLPSGQGDEATEDAAED